MTAHGTRYGFKSGCTCDKCRAWHRRHRNLQLVRRAEGRGAYTAAAPVRTHVQSLIEAGLGVPQIAKRSGVDPSGIAFLLRGSPRKGHPAPRRILRVNAAALLAVTVRDLAAGARVDAVGARRRVQALVVEGWSLSEIGRRAGVARSGVVRLVEGQRTCKATADRLSALFEELGAPPATSPRERTAVT